MSNENVDDVLLVTRMTKKDFGIIQEKYLEKNDGELNLIKRVRESLLNVFPEERVIEFYDNNSLIGPNMDLNNDTQRFVLNRYWSSQLYKSTENTTNLRRSLIPNGSHNEWLNIFQDLILPFISSNNLLS